MRLLYGNLRVQVFRGNESVHHALLWSQALILAALVQLVEELVVLWLLGSVLQKAGLSDVLGPPGIVSIGQLPLVEELVIRADSIFDVYRDANGSACRIREDALGAERKEHCRRRDEAEEKGPSALQRPLHVGGVDSDASPVHLLNALEESRSASFRASAKVSPPKHVTNLLELLASDRSQVAFVAFPEGGPNGPGEVRLPSGLGWEARSMPVYQDHLLQGLRILCTQGPRAATTLRVTGSRNAAGRTPSAKPSAPGTVSERRSGGLV